MREVRRDAHGRRALTARIRIRFVAPLVLVAAAAIAASAMATAQRPSAIGDVCGIHLPPPRFGEPGFRIPQGGSARAERLAGGALACILRRADGTRFARAYRDNLGLVLGIAFYRKSGLLLAAQDQLVAAGTASNKPAQVKCGASNKKSLGPKFWNSFPWRIGKTVSGISEDKAVKAIRDAVSEWVNNKNYCGIKDQSSVPARYDGRTSAAYKHDGKNVVDWGSLSNDQSCSSALACTLTWYDSNGKPVESDIRLNTKYAWAIGAKSGKYDIQSTAAHEFGHVFQLDHVTGSNTLVMWPYLGQNNTSAHKLGKGDAQADNANY